MSTLLSLNALARKLDKASPTVQRRVNAGQILPVANTSGGRLLFDGSKVDEYKNLFARKPAEVTAP
jgi:hypothetical protein